ncbi:MAG: peptidoglycan bridge formation glycyltransferase FemA/FemB family protein [Candidatus Andersenbacteria bacterium]|nr:peptidoglycan bridge formation glycyltransferase FemA/FemB family protein [Candidatus Andersenbacteria bacterium]
MPQLDSETWDVFVARAPGGSFLQSWGWGEVQRRFGVSIWRLAEWRGAELVAAALVLKRPVPSGQGWLYVPRGPLTDGAGEVEIGNALQNQLTAKAREQRAIFVRVEPPAAVPAGGAAENKLSGLGLGSGWQKADHDVQPRNTLVVDVRPSDEEMLAAMHPKTRYNIGLARRHGVTVRFSQEAADLDSFLRLGRDVAARSVFRFHPDDYYWSLWRVLSGGTSSTPGVDGETPGVFPVPRAVLELAVAEHEEDVLAVHLLVSFGDTVTYVHGASSSRRRGLMAPHLLQWESMRRTKARGFRYYDFFGIAPPFAEATGGKPPGDPHPWVGITRFKEGFGGQRVSYPGAYDFVLNSLTYWLYNAARRLSH